MNGDSSNSNGHTNPISASTSTSPSPQQQQLQQCTPAPSVSMPPPPASDPTATTALGLNRQELVRLLVQSMDSLGYPESARHLEQEAGIEAMSYDMRRLRNCVLNGEWEKLEAILNSINKIFKNESDEKLARFVIYEQKFLELLESRRTAEALDCLRNHLTHLSPDPKLFNKLPLLCLCATPSEVREHAAWPGTGYVSRSTVLKKLYKYIPSYHLLQENRLENLLLQTIQFQKKKTMFPYTRQKFISLLEDMEHCTDRVPTSKLYKLFAHTDEVWFVQFSHSGHFLASASKDSTVIIWDIKALLQQQSNNSNSNLTNSNNLNNGNSKMKSSKTESRRSRRMRDDDEEDDDDDDDDEEEEEEEEEEEDDDDGDEDEAEYTDDDDNDNDNDEIEADNEVELTDEDDNDGNNVKSKSSSGINIKDDRFIYKKLEGHTDMIACLSWSPKNERDGNKSDQRLLSCGHDRTLRLWNVSTGECLRVFEGHTKEIIACVWLPDGVHFISGGIDGKIFEWDSRTGTTVGTYEAKSHVNDLTISRDGKMLIVTCSNRTIQIFNTQTRKEEMVLIETVSITSMYLSHDNECLMVCTNSTEDPEKDYPEVHIWKLRDRKIIKTLKGFKQARYVIRGCFAGFENMFVICGSEDGLVHIWERSSGELITKLNGHRGTVSCVAVSEADENLFASGSDDKTVILWGVRQQRQPYP